MEWSWKVENPAVWDEHKARIIASAPEGAFPDLADAVDGQLLGATWWRVEREGEVLGYGWMDATWGWAPVMLAVHPDAQRSGVGAFIVQKLRQEAHKRGLAYVFNVIPATHPDRDGITAFLTGQGFEPAAADGNMLRLRTQG